MAEPVPPGVTLDCSLREVVEVVKELEAKNFPQSSEGLLEKARLKGVRRKLTKLAVHVDFAEQQCDKLE